MRNLAEPILDRNTEGNTQEQHDRWVENLMRATTRVVTSRYCLVAMDRLEPGTVGYEPFPNQDWSQGATNNAS